MIFTNVQVGISHRQTAVTNPRKDIQKINTVEIFVMMSAKYEYSTNVYVIYVITGAKYYTRGSNNFCSLR